MPDKNRVISMEEVAKHNSPGDAWIVIKGDVFNISTFADLHPGGRHVIQQWAGKDATQPFQQFHHDGIMMKYKQRLKIGILRGYTERPRLELPGSFGDMIPYGDPIWYQRFNSPYYNDSHRQWREKVRKFTDEELLPTVADWKESNRPPAELVQRMGRLGFLAAMCGPPYPAKYLDADVRDQEPANFDYFHELILYDELSRCGSSGVIGALTNGPAIALSAIMRFGTEEQRLAVAPDVLMGRKFIALAVSEPNAGSDVAGMVTTAKQEGDVYVVNGNKKWITNGMYADWHVVAVVTGKPGHNGLSFLLVDKATDGFSVRKVQVRGAEVTGTAYLDFDNCRIPVANRIGPENQGFKLIMWNFNHERFYITAVVSRMSRVCLEESVRYALKRKTFGKALHEHQSIRMKIAAMTRAVEQLHTWLEFMTYQLCTMSTEEANTRVGDVMSLLKVQCSKVYEFCARETTQIFGGNALYVGGMGDKIEPAVNQVKGYQIPAGAEDIMDDFGARMAFKMAAQFAKL